MRPERKIDGKISRSRHEESIWLAVSVSFWWVILPRVWAVCDSRMFCSFEKIDGRKAGKYSYNFSELISVLEEILDVLVKIRCTKGSVLLEQFITKSFIRYR